MEFPTVETLITLSPMPKLKPWLIAKLTQQPDWDPGSRLLEDNETCQLIKFVPEALSGNEALLKVLMDPQ